MVRKCDKITNFLTFQRAVTHAFIKNVSASCAFKSVNVKLSDLSAPELIFITVGLRLMNKVQLFAYFREFGFSENSFKMRK